MAKRQEIEKFIADYLSVGDFDDYCVNGIQVEGKEDVNKIILGTSVSERLIKKAIDANADMIIVHHGLFWKKGEPVLSVTGSMKKRLELLIKNDITLAGYHLPLDANKDVGNNTELCKLLDLTPLEPVFVGWLAKNNVPCSFKDFVKKVKSKLNLEPFTIEGNERIVNTVLVISGGADDYYQDAIKNGADLFVTGSIDESRVRTIEEERLNFINLGHYNSEKYGVQALGKIIESKFNVQCEYIDIPNPI